MKGPSWIVLFGLDSQLAQTIRIPMYIALLEDEPFLATEVQDLLIRLGHAVVHFRDGHEIMRGLLKDTFDLFVLDWQVPGPDGMAVLRHIRKHLKLNTPVVFLTVCHVESQVVDALNAGADDYCVKPLRSEEFTARLAALQRRMSVHVPETQDGEIYPGYVFNQSLRHVLVDGVAVTLTEKEFELSRLLFTNLDRPLARGRIMLEVWGRDEAALSRTLDVHISWIRKKLQLGADATRLRLMVVHGFGYRLMKLTSNEGSSVHG